MHTSPDCLFRKVNIGRFLLVILAVCSTFQAGAAPVVPSPIPLANIDTAPTNVALALSVEFPTGDTTTYATSAYVSTKTYLGYFDPAKCYSYNTTNLYFSPTTCSSSTPKGNFLNWATMTGLDQFRKVMTGGTRFKDDVSLTVLQRAVQDGESYGASLFPNMSGKYADAGNMGATTTMTWKNGNMGDKILVQSGTSVTTTNLTATDLVLNDCPSLVTKYKSKNGNKNPPWTCYHVRVEVCQGSNPESNCTKYGSNYKPEGLMQQYYKNLRFAAFGYLNDQSLATQGGVLRARMKAIGPVVPDALSGTVSNPNSEWNASTGVYVTNPDPADATASSTLSGKTISNSGVMNYLNKFGYAPDSTYGYAYKGYDPMAELFYEATRYLRGATPSSQAVANATSSNPSTFDGFPVIKFKGKGTSDDPVVNACQPNVIVAIGDVNNWCDSRVPGGSVNANCGGTLPTDPNSISFATPTNQIDSWESSAIGSGNSPGRYAGWYMGGIAYWSHTNDIRPDLAGSRLPGEIQKIDTYFFDVMEGYNGGSHTGATVTPFWTAAKYGGFDMSLTDQTSATTKVNPNSFKSGSTVKSWDIDNDNVPDNWFGAKDPVAMQTALSNLFKKLAKADTGGKGSSPAASGVSIASAKYRYLAGYKLQTNGGTGSLKACNFSSSNCSTDFLWDSALWLTETPTPPTPYTYQTWDKRQIITRSGGSGVPFLYGNLVSTDQNRFGFSPSTQLADPVTNPTVGEQRVKYLRGDASLESGSSAFRSRSGGTKLGDIVNSGLTYVGAPSSMYIGKKFSGYSDFVLSNASRKPVLYVGANDGMMHAFDAANGKELLSYVPGYFLKPDSGKSSARISALTDPAYTHQFFVDSTPMVNDVKIGDAWKSILVGGLGAGGKAFYALDVTDPGSLSESGASKVVKWELSDAEDGDIGYTYNQRTLSAISGQALQYALVPTGATSSKWGVLVGNGFGSSTGKAALLILDPDTGSIISKVVADNGPDNGLATPYPIDTDHDGVIDTVWAGDLKGTMWRFRWSGSAWSTTALYQGGVSQPITSAPSVTSHCSIVGAYNVVFGTGKYIERGDYKTKDQQTIYGIIDKLDGTTVAQSQLLQQTFSESSGVRSYSSNSVNTATQKGWYLNLPTTNGERVISNPMYLPDSKITAIGSFAPATTCLPATGYVNVVDRCSGGKVSDANGEIKGFSGYGIPSFGAPISDRSVTYLATGLTNADGSDSSGGSGGGSPAFLKTTKKYNSGLRGSWRQLK